MKWSEYAWQSISDIYSKILKLPFITELMNGTLSKDKFHFYIQQDAIYLADFGKVLAGIAYKSPNTSHAKAFLGFANDTISVEQVLHESFLREINNSYKPEASPSCLLYTSFMHKQFANASLEVAMASVLPCFWIYKEVGDYILANQIESANPYQEWIDTYGGHEYGKAVESAISICNELASYCTQEQRKDMTDAFKMCSKMEWMFWESAYRQEKWSV